MIDSKQQSELDAHYKACEEAAFQASVEYQATQPLRDEITALKAELENCHQQDRLKTREINILTPENRGLSAENAALKAKIASAQRQLIFSEQAQHPKVVLAHVRNALAFLQ